MADPAWLYVNFYTSKFYKMTKTVKGLTFVILFGGFTLCVLYETLKVRPRGVKSIIPVRKSPYCLKIEEMLEGNGSYHTLSNSSLSRQSDDAKEGYTYVTEEEMLTGNDIHDPRTWANAMFSTLELSPKRRSFSLGDNIRVEITLYDSFGKRRTHGGDYLRLWMENTQLKASVSGKIIDYNNGTFIGLLKAMWSGPATISVSIARRREEIAYYYQLYHCFHSLWGSYAEFSNGKSKETVICSIIPLNFTSEDREWCDLTMKNDGFPWYCLKPNNTGLTCNMWTSIWSDWESPFFKHDIINSFNQRTDERFLLFPGLSVEIKGSEHLMLPSPSVACHKVPPEETWKRKSPNGFFYHDKWIPSLCTSSVPSNSPGAYGECLRGKTMWLLGDSTSAQFSEALHTLFNIPMNARGHNPYLNYCGKYNFSVSWYAHELPFYHGQIQYQKHVNQAAHVFLDDLPNNTEDIVVMYMYVHFTLNHPVVFRRHVQRLVQSAQKVIARAPKVALAVRGPHAFYMTSTPLILSYWGLRYIDILHEEFAVLQKHVVYLDYWDLGVARSNDIHPEPETVSTMVHYMMSMLCQRNKE